MDSKKLVALLNGRNGKILLAVLLYFIGIANYLGIAVFYWHWTFDPFDQILHFVSGLWLALAVLIYCDVPSSKLKAFLFVLGVVALVGVIWEFVEYTLEILMGGQFFLAMPGLYQDTLGDLLADLAGGALAAGISLLVRKRS